MSGAYSELIEATRVAEVIRVRIAQARRIPTKGNKALLAKLLVAQRAVRECINQKQWECGRQDGAAAGPALGPDVYYYECYRPGAAHPFAAVEIEDKGSRSIVHSCGTIDADGVHSMLKPISEQANTLGTRSVRAILQAVFEAHPHIDALEGDRLSGARVLVRAGGGKWSTNRNHVMRGADRRAAVELKRRTA